MSSRALEAFPLPRSANRKWLLLKELWMPEILPPLRNSIPVLYCIKCGWLRCLSEPFVRCCLHLPNTPTPMSPSKHHFCRSSSVCLLQSRQSSPLNTPHFPWKAMLSHCSATWPAPTVSTRKATGWRMGRKSRKHAPQIGTPNTSRSHGKTLCNLWVCVRALNTEFSSLLWVHVRCVSALQAGQTKRRRRRSVHVCLHLQECSSSQRHHWS